ncbi:hypothetical protein [Teredinibacter purpureus]|uniref:hypothetical protein n=1 Tax=Teredinibacter purpureus TaxID=2731756 RepID=UPI0005F84BE8|nr:hypothetical protein [Teredinibacter purpureus]
MKKWYFIVAVTLGLTSCEKNEHRFELTVDKVELLKGFMLKGLALSGTVTYGCIANEDWFFIQRNGELVQKADTRLLKIANLKAGEAFDGKANKGDYATFFIPDGNTGDVLVGDSIVSSTVSCQ